MGDVLVGIVGSHVPVLHRVGETVGNVGAAVEGEKAARELRESVCRFDRLVLTANREDEVSKGVVSCAEELQALVVISVCVAELVASANDTTARRCGKCSGQRGS